VGRLTKTLGGLIAVQDVSFEVRKRKILAFLGPNEAGKSTIVSILTFPDRVFYNMLSVFSRRRHALGLRPNAALNVRQKLALSLNP
jgi:ABC-type branched-subunit amino acid transport system ATPase component